VSDKTVAEKLYIKANYKILLINAPAGYQSVLGELPPGVTILEKPAGLVDMIQMFITSKKELEEQLGGLKQWLKPNSLLWVAYPKGTSKIKVDINRDSINAYAQSIGLQGVAMISIDDTWSALRLKRV
jgi:hypothetical protein